jgi:hypothetical protein
VVAVVDMVAVDLVDTVDMMRVPTLKNKIELAFLESFSLLLP